MKRLQPRQLWQQLRGGVRPGVRALILVHAGPTGLGLLAIGLLLAVWLLFQTFFMPPSVVPVAEVGERRLSTDLIDRLELWIEAVEDERRAGLQLPARPLFVVDDAVSAEE